jgi:hypothetical protein
MAKDGRNAGVERTQLSLRTVRTLRLEESHEQKSDQLAWIANAPLYI